MFEERRLEMTDRCQNKKYQEMLAAYEMGMLDEKERAELELHLYECEYCFARVQEFEKAAHHIQHNPAAKENIKGIVESLPEVETGKSNVFKFISGKKRWPSYIPASVIVIAVLLFLILKPWRLEFQPQQEAEAAATRLAIVDFKNLTSPEDPRRLGSTIANLLTTALSEALPMKVVSNERLNDVLRMYGKTQQDTEDRETAMIMARRTSARWILYGSIIEENTGLTVTMQLTEARSGEVLNGHRIAAGANESIFNLADRLAAEISKDLAFSAENSSAERRPVADITTHSSEAYRYYLEGVDLYQKFYINDAAASFHKALGYDSTLAMAWYYLAKTENAENIWRASKYSKNATQLQQLYIAASAYSIMDKRDSACILYQKIVKTFPDEKRAYLELGVKLSHLNKFDSSIQVLNEGIKVDPLFKGIYNQLAYMYNAVGKFDSAIWAIDKYIELSPDEANPYDSRGAIYASNGMTEQAIESYRKALIIKPDFFTAVEEIGHIYFLKGDYKRADSCYQELEQKATKFTKSWGRILRAIIPYGQGRIKATISGLDSCIMMDKREPVVGVIPRITYLKAFIYHGLENYPLAVKYYEKAVTVAQELNPKAQLPFHEMYVQMLVQDGQAKKAEMTNKGIQDYNEQAGGYQNYYQYGLAAIAFANKDYKTALANLIKICDDRDIHQNFYCHYFLGQVYFAMHDWGGVIREYEAQLKIYSYEHIRHFLWHNSMHYYLGIAYEEQQMYDKAISHYQRFLDIYSNADPGIPNLADARSRLARLVVKG
jgi:tetratricopeptide (TPR) repeat protein